MGQLVGVVLGGLFWVWVFSKVARRLGASALAGIWMGYFATIGLALAAHLTIGFSMDGVQLYVVCALVWAFLLDMRERRRTPAEQQHSVPAQSPSQGGRGSLVVLVGLLAGLLMLVFIPKWGENPSPTRARSSSPAKTQPAAVTPVTAPNQSRSSAASAPPTSGPTSPIPSAPPSKRGDASQFDRTALSASVIASQLSTCRIATKQLDPSVVLRGAWADNYCACSVDATIQNKGSAPHLVPEDHAATYSQLDRCRQFADSAHAIQTTTPYSRGRWTAATIVRQVEACERRNTDSLGETSARHYCSCYVDALRTQTVRPVVPAEQDALCRTQANAPGR